MLMNPAGINARGVPDEASFVTAAQLADGSYTASGGSAGSMLAAVSRPMVFGGPAAETG